MNRSIEADGSSAADEKQTAFPGLPSAVGWIILYFLLQFLVTAVLIATKAGADPAAVVAATRDGVTLLWGLVVSAAIQLALMWLYLRKRGRAGALGLTHFGRLSVGITVAIAIAAIVTATLFNYVYATYIIQGAPMQDELAKLLASIPRTPLNIALGLLAIAVAAPVTEELLFRGFLQKSLAHRLPVWAAIMLSAFVFSLVHMQLYAIPALMSLGVAFGYIYHRTGSLLMTIVLHMVNNLLALALTQAI